MLLVALHLAIYSFMALFPIVNPVGTTPIFLAMTTGASLETRHRLSRRVSIYACALLVVSLVLGGLIIEFFGIKIAHVEIAGGLVVFYTAWEMLNVRDDVAPSQLAVESGRLEQIAFFPLTLPITAGPGSIAVAIAVSSRIAHRPLDAMLFGYLGAMVGVLVVALTIWLCFRFAQGVFAKLGTTGTMVFTKMAAFILMAIGVEIFWSGLSQLIIELR
ncbi:MAG: NAAT family transporter [Thermoanaerobaculaceae bacterium]|jgi:multiple antibiotic resistance protein